MAAELENMTQAAKELHISQPSLSRTISELENELNCQLFIRNSRSITLNENGKYFYHKIKNALNIIDLASQEVSSQDEAYDQVISLRCEKSSQIIPAVMKYLKNALPSIKILLVQRGLEDDWMNHCDFEFTTQKIKNNKNFLLLKEEVFVAVSKSSNLSNKKSMKFQDLKYQNIVMSRPNPLRSVIENSFKENGVSIKPKFVTSDISTQHALIKNNFGIGFVPQYSWLYNDFSDTCLLSLSPQKVYRNIYLSYYPSKTPKKYHEQVRKLILKYFKKMIEN
ncbi:LysR family transcriptional regulator [Liquorilactobacillus vini DSM 20605]|uniref:LysR family transcriptional regulator n=3 Tax=Liquorilactobacillus vini TaxID=238015 RepID=A0A0R2CBU2_9LACO|nr:LysR family transcriptional regulator [Liquorilactobacillus vini DSM 20605]